MTSGAIPAGEVARKRIRPLDQGSSSAEPPGLGLDCQESLVRYLARVIIGRLPPFPNGCRTFVSTPAVFPKIGAPKSDVSSWRGDVKRSLGDHAGR